jgi:hypothetical protein
MVRITGAVPDGVDKVVLTMPNGEQWSAGVVQETVGFEVPQAAATGASPARVEWSGGGGELGLPAGMTTIRCG